MEKSQIKRVTVVRFSFSHLLLVISQPAFTCSKLIIKTLEQGVKYVQVNHKDDIVLVSLLLTLNIFHTLL